MYESFLDFFNKKSSPSIKLAISIVSLFNSIDNNLKCYYIKNNNLISIKNNNEILLTIMFYKIKVNDSYYFDAIKFEELNLEKYKNIKDFMIDVLDVGDIITFKHIDIKENDIPNIIDNLTKENYDDFLIQMSANKFNI